MEPPRRGNDAPLLEAAEKAGIQSHPQSIGDEDARPQNPRKMSSMSRMALALTLCLLVAVGMASAVSVSPRTAWSWPCQRGLVAGEQDSLPAAKHASFLTSLGGETPSLGDLLRKFLPDRFRHDVLSLGGKPETEAGARPEAYDEVAIGLLQLARRDGTNSTTSEPPASSPSSSAPAESSTSSSEEIQSDMSATTTPSSTPGSTGTSSPGVSATSTIAGATTTTALTSKLPSTTGPTSTTMKSETKTSQSFESSALTTYTSTSTDSNGSVVVVTGTTFVGVGVKQSTTGSSAKATDSLQTNAAPSAVGRVAGLEWIVGLAVGGALLLVV